MVEPYKIASTTECSWNLQYHRRNKETVDTNQKTEKAEIWFSPTRFTKKLGSGSHELLAGAKE
jgi:hypothetical protein